jgi:hypothetical protein
VRKLLLAFFWAAATGRGAPARRGPPSLHSGRNAKRKQLFFLVGLVVASSPALAVNIDWVQVGNPGNATDTANNCGSRVLAESGPGPEPPALAAMGSGASAGGLEC